MYILYMTEILPNLFLGNMDYSLNIGFIQLNKINCVINCTINKPFLDCIKYKYRIPIKDDKTDTEAYLLYLILDKVVEIIKQHIYKNDIILVHCYAGKQRSVSCILAFLMKYGNMNLDIALKLLKARYPIAGEPQLNFYKSLKYYENKLLDDKKLDT
jgi:hypothetical protein